mmetsp:Transcript_203/g.338  ORF Transcript_203/g.338 Transcript_203/m.338 type:complete len:192 (+) Transcript_203:99-674(+)
MISRLVTISSILILGSVLGFSQAFNAITIERSCCRLQNRNNFSTLQASKNNFSEGDDDISTSRRSILQKTLTTAASSLFLAANVAITHPTTATALDFDAFESSQISKDSSSANPELSEDAALCKYGAPGKAMGEACKRANMKPRLPADVRADGKVDRGDYTKCVDQWNIVDDKYVKSRLCKPISEWGPEVK